MYQTLIKAEQLVSHLNDRDWLIFDCRFDLANVHKGQALYEDSHIPGAVYAHLDKHLSSPISADSGRHPLPDSNKLVEWLASCGLTSTTQVVVYDDSYGAMSSRLWWLLKCLGHEEVALLDGGWQAWQRQDLAVDSQHPVLQRSNYQGHFNDAFIVTTNQVLQNIQTPEFQLIDVRTQQRFSGEMEPIDPVAGHIPGAINIPLGDNLDEQGLFKSVSELTAMYAAVNALHTTDKQVYMCGSGVTACHSVFAQALMGHALPAVYAGSWSEWIRDSNRPVATSPE